MINERLLTRAEWEAIVNGLSDGSTCRNCREAITEAQDKKTSAARLRQCGEWLAKVLYSSQYAGKRIATLERSMEALKRGEEPWGVQP